MTTINLGALDRLVRLAAAMALMTVLRLGVLPDVAAQAAVVVMAMLGLTAVGGFCPLYLLLRIDTSRPQRGGTGWRA